jgi:hypothetical protein
MSIEQIQSLVDALASRLRRAVVVDDQDLRLIAVSEDFGDADAARIWSLLHRRTRPEDVAYAEIKQLAGPVRIPENPALELWQRLCVPIRACPPPLPPVFLQMPGTGPATCNAALDDFRSAR